MPKYFGTDGVRGVANRDLTPEFALALGRAAGMLLQESYPAPGERPSVVVGRDTRVSGTMLQQALAAGLTSVGVDVLDAGIFPTPGVSWLTRELGAASGAVISASHNPAPDNGIKFFTADGFKYTERQEEQIEDLLEQENPGPRPEGGEVGTYRPLPRAEERYLDYLAGLVPAPLEGWRVAVDGANGAAYRLGPDLLRRLGAQVVPLGDQPDGLNINQGCGSTEPEALMRAVAGQGAHLGVAFDGDADRLLAVDEQGNLVDGDQLLHLFARYLNDRGQLDASTVVVTVMSNLGLEVDLEERGLACVRTPVGDRHVLTEMLERGAVLGGEQSGHIIFLRHVSTGDGLVTAAMLLSALQEWGEPLSRLAADMPQFPQVLINVKVPNPKGFNGNSRLQEAVAQAEEAFSGRGRIVVRPSGTEPKVRVMVEGEDRKEAEEIGEGLAQAIREELG